MHLCLLLFRFTLFVVAYGTHLVGQSVHTALHEQLFPSFDGSQSGYEQYLLPYVVSSRPRSCILNLYICLSGFQPPTLLLLLSPGS